MPDLDRNFWVTCGKCGTSVKKKHPSRHKLSCSGGILICPKCLNFSNKSRDSLNDHIATKRAIPRVKIAHKCKICFEEFSGFYALRQHKISEHGIQMRSAEFDKNNLLEDDDADLKEKPQHFPVDSELEKGRYRVFSFAMSTLDNSLIIKNWI